jgi:hypothetical protein
MYIPCSKNTDDILECYLVVILLYGFYILSFPFLGVLLSCLEDLVSFSAVRCQIALTPESHPEDSSTGCKPRPQAPFLPPTAMIFHAHPCSKLSSGCDQKNVTAVNIHEICKLVTAFFTTNIQFYSPKARPQ